MPEEISREEQELRGETLVEAAVDNFANSMRRQFQEETAAVLRKYTGVKREDVVETAEPALRRDTEKVDPMRYRSNPTDSVYARMSEAERSIRSPEVDHYIAEWARGLYYKDAGRMARADEKLKGLHPDLYVQRDYLQGTAGASGAFSDGTGGDWIPRPLEELVAINRDQVAKMRRFANIFQMTAQQHNIPTGDAFTGSKPGEGATATVETPTAAEVPIIATKMQITAVSSLEMLEDTAVNLVNFLSTRAGARMGAFEDEDFCGSYGGANSVPTIAPATVVPLTTGQLTYAKIQEIYHTTPQVYRANGIWLVAADVLEGLSSALATDGRPFYQGFDAPPQAVTDDPQQEGTLLRKPVYEMPFVDGTIVFADVRALYTIGNRMGIRATASEHVLFDEDKIKWKWTQRYGANNVDTAAGAYTIGATDFTP